MEIWRMRFEGNNSAVIMESREIVVNGIDDIAYHFFYLELKTWHFDDITWNDLAWLLDFIFTLIIA